MAASLAERSPLLNITGPLTVKEVEARIFHAARNEPRIETCQRTWMEEDRSYFVRWRRAAPDSPLLVVGLVFVLALPEMASRVTVVAFDEDVDAGSLLDLNRYVELLHKELAAESFG